MSAPYLGDFADDQTVHFMWSSNDGDGASVTRATDGTVSVYKDNGATQTTTGVTDTEDFDSLTGIHVCTIATTDAFYATGSNYTVILSASTIDGQTVNAVLAHFSIENRYDNGTLKPTVAGRTLDVTTGGAAGVDWGNVENPTTAVDLSGTDIQLCDTVTTLTGHTAQTADHTAAIADVPTVAEFNARTLVAAAYFDPAADTVATVTDVTNLHASAATSAAQTTAQNDLDTITGSDGVTLATAQGLYAPSKAGDAMALTSGERNSTADAFLDRDMSTGTDSGSTTVRTVRQALRFLRNKWSIVTGTLTVTKEDDSTASWTSAVTDSASANPLTASDPAGP